MELTKVENVVLISLVAQNIGIDGLIAIIGEEKVNKIETITNDFVGNTTPNEMALVGPNVIKKLADSILEITDCKLLS